MTKVFLKKLNEIQPSQLFISSEKLSDVITKLESPLSRSLEPVPIKELDGEVIFTDGHTRAFTAFLAGLEEIRVCWEDEDLDWEEYRICVKWCKTEGIYTIADLKMKVVSPEDYEVLWYERCEEMQNDLKVRRKMNYSKVIVSQYLAALEMLKEAIVKCPDSIWNDPGDRTKFWHITYHALFYTHLYLQDSEGAFTPWLKHRKEYQFLGQVPWPPHAAPQIGEPYDKATMLEYLSFCQRHVVERVPQLDLEAASGFNWLPFGKLELQFYTVRHIQQHTGELMERLGSRASLDLPWVGTKPD